MAIISFDKDAVVDYIPAYGGNRDSDDPCVVKMKFVPYSRVQDYSRLIVARTKGINDPLRATEVTQSVQRKQFVDNIEAVHNYFVGEEEVVDAGRVYDTADTEFIIEIIRAMESHSKLTEGQVKN